MVSEVVQTEEQLAQYMEGNIMYFRPPYNDWTPQLAATINAGLKNSKFDYQGPFDGEIDGSDWAYWEKGEGPEACAESYMNVIRKQGSGIILMHDSCADDELIKKNNRTYETLKIIIPQIKKEGYRFVGLDEVVKLSGNPLIRGIHSLKDLTKRVRNRVK